MVKISVRVLKQSLLNKATSKKIDGLVLFNQYRWVYKKLRASAHPTLAHRTPLNARALQTLRKQVRDYLRPLSGMKGITSGS